MSETREFIQVRAELNHRIEVLEAALRPLAEAGLNGRPLRITRAQAQQAQAALRDNIHPNNPSQDVPLDHLVPRTTELGERLIEALSECAAYSKRGWRYWFREASMMRLEELGLVETWRPEQVVGAPRRRKLPWRPTQAGLDWLRDNDIVARA